MSISMVNPLSWPATRPRSTARKRSPFAAPNHRAFRELRTELQRLDVEDARITIDLKLERRDDLPLSNAREPADQGVAVYYRRGGREHVLACDAYNLTAGNASAICHTIEALRGITRWSCMSVDEAIAGSRLALPGEIQVARPWREVIGGAWPDGLDPADLLAIAKRRYLLRAAELHPDTAGGDHDAAAELNAAIAEAKRELGGGA